jgi:two-component sensor histidine kinase
MTVGPPFEPTVIDSLSLSMVSSSDAPLLLLDGDLVVIAASQTFCQAFQPNAAQVRGESIFAIGAGEWDRSQLRALLTATAAGKAAVDAYEMDLHTPERATRRLVIRAQKLEYGAAEVTRVLMTVSDVTEARIAERVKDDLLRDKAMLLQEVQHRVANSLQIIASVLMQSARKVNSEETRRHLADAHSRVMSIATVQRQLSSSGQADVELRPYFTQLCQSLGASMIRDHNQQSIEVTGDKSVVGADISISLGLIVTELVINALKHAFPDGRAGKIIVGYHAQGPNWTLSVADNGVGMPGPSQKASPGLGSSIVEALSRQLGAQVRVTDKKPGTDISIAHTKIAAVGQQDSEPRARLL